MATFEGRFIDTESWQKRYQRNHRKCGGKHIRCFPYCKTTHRSTTFCGHSLKFELQQVDEQAFDENERYTMVMEFAPVDPSVEFMKLNQTHSEFFQNRIASGDTIPTSTLLQKVAARREAIIWYQHSLETVEEDCTSDAGDINDQGLPTFSLNDFSPEGRAFFTFNKEERAYHYGFIGSKSIKNIEHQVRVLLFCQKEKGTLQCLSVFESPTFNLFGRKSRTRAKATKDLLSPKIESIGFVQQMNSIRPIQHEKRRISALHHIHAQDDPMGMKRLRKDSLSNDFETFAHPGPWQSNEQNNPFSLLHSLDFMNMLPPSQMGAELLNPVYSASEKSTSAKLATLAAWHASLDGEELEGVLSSGVGEVVNNLICQRSAGVLRPETFMQVLVDSILSLPVCAHLTVTYDDHEAHEMESLRVDEIVQRQYEMNQLWNAPQFGQSSLHVFVNGFCGSWSRGVGSLNLSNLLPNNSFSTMLSRKLETFEMRFDIRGEQNFLYLKENDIMFDVGAKKMLLNDRLIEYPRVAKSLFQESLGLRYYRCAINISLGHLVICSYYDNVKLLNIMRVKSQYEIEEVFVVFTRDQSWSGPDFDEASWKEVGRVCSWVQRM